LKNMTIEGADLSLIDMDTVAAVVNCLEFVDFSCSHLHKAQREAILKKALKKTKLTHLGIKTDDFYGEECQEKLDKIENLISLL